MWHSNSNNNSQWDTKQYYFTSLEGRAIAGGGGGSEGSGEKDCRSWRVLKRQVLFLLLFDVVRCEIEFGTK